MRFEFNSAQGEDLVGLKQAIMNFVATGTEDVEFLDRLNHITFGALNHAKAKLRGL